MSQLQMRTRSQETKSPWWKQHLSTNLLLRKKHWTEKRVLIFDRINLLCFCLLCSIPILGCVHTGWTLVLAGRMNLDTRRGSNTAILYSYFEKDQIQVENFEFFIRLGYVPHRDLPHLFFGFIINGEVCTPCRGEPELSNIGSDSTPQHSVKQWSSRPTNLKVLRNKENKGMDFGAWHKMLDFLIDAAILFKYEVFVFLNSSTKGPFLPKYYPKLEWWMAYRNLLQNDVHAVGSSLVCLPKEDLGGPGPRIESWAFALTLEATQLLMKEKIFEIRSEKYGRYVFFSWFHGDVFLISTTLQKGKKGQRHACMQ